MTGRENPGSNHPARATYDEKTLADQQRFLDAFPGIGNISETAKSVGIAPSQVYWWRNHNILGFHARYLQAREEDADTIESEMRKRVKNPSFNGRIGSDILLIAQANAKRPDEYRPQGVPVVQVSEHVLRALGALALEDAQARAQLPPPEANKVVEGQVVDEPMPWEADEGG